MIYMDYNATTPVHPKVVEAMLPFLWEHYGNPSSAHQAGFVAREAVEKARASVAAVIRAKPEEIYFTSGATEANNLAMKGHYPRPAYEDNCIITSSVEHHATLRAARSIRSHFRETIMIPVDQYGRLDLEALRSTLEEHNGHALVSVMHANNETGNMFWIEQIGLMVKEAGGILHVDAAQTFGKIPIDVDSLGIDMLSISGHKIYAPKGIGALYVREGVNLDAQITGGHQERDLRAGTENVPGIVGLGKAAEIAGTWVKSEVSAGKSPGQLWIEPLNSYQATNRLRGLTDKLHEGLSAIDGARFNSYPEANVGNTLNVSFDGVDGEALCVLLDQRGICVSHGAACESGTPEPSHVLKAMGRSDEEATGAIRISVGIHNTIEEVNAVIDAIAEIVKEYRS